MQSLDIDTLTSIIFIVLTAMGIIAIMITMGYMVYGEEEED